MLNDMQKLFDLCSDAARDSRKNYHLTLGNLIEVLKGADGRLLVEFDTGGAPDNPHSYRGYYEDLAFGAAKSRVTAAEFLAMCENALGKEYQGYKGGEFVMGADTPLWRSEYGYASGTAIIGGSIGNELFVLATKQID